VVYSTSKLDCHDIAEILLKVGRPEMTNFKMFREKVNMDFYFVGITF
jgi:hypothetical protein